jgi:hypothetical protein
MIGTGEPGKEHGRPPSAYFTGSVLTQMGDRLGFSLLDTCIFVSEKKRLVML